MQNADISKDVAASIQKNLDAGLSVKIYPRGYSMFPLLVQDRDSVIVSPSNSKTFHRGAIYLYQRSNGILVLHRLHHRKKGCFYFVGDNQTQIEGPINKEQIFGVVTTITRKNNTFSTRHPIYVIMGHIWLLVRPIRPILSKTAKKLLTFFHIGQK